MKKFVIKSKKNELLNIVFNVDENDKLINIENKWHINTSNHFLIGHNVNVKTIKLFIDKYNEKSGNNDLYLADILQKENQIKMQNKIIKEKTLKNEKISLKENSQVNSLVQKYSSAIKKAITSGGEKQADILKEKLKGMLEKMHYDWQNDNRVVGIMYEGKKNNTTKPAKKVETKNIETKKNTLEEKKIAILKQKIEEATGKKVVLKENLDEDEVGKKNLINWISGFKINSYNLYSFSKNTKFGKENLSKYTEGLKKAYLLGAALEDNFG